VIDSYLGGPEIRKSAMPFGVAPDARNPPQRQGEQTAGFSISRVVFQGTPLSSKNCQAEGLVPAKKMQNARHPFSEWRQTQEARQERKGSNGGLLFQVWLRGNALGSPENRDG
jgi:hypothetical protein